MDPSSSDSALNPGDVDYEFESNEVPEFLRWCILQSVYSQFMALKPLSVVDNELVPKVGMTFRTLEDAGKFYRNYAKAAGNAPKGFLTDQCASIKRALEACMPTTVHRWCIWHIMKKIPSKLNGYKAHADVEQQMSHVVWNSHSKDSFDRNWNDFLVNFGLADNKWLSDLYEDRHIWVPIYLDHHFWAGMRSTQRSESMHSFFNKYITRNSSLIQFVKQYDNCLGSREQAERESDAADFHTVIPCATKSPIETQFQDAYTQAKFREVQAQFRGKANCITRLKNSALGYSVYEVGEQVSSSILDKFAVTYDSVTAEINLFDAASAAHSSSSQYQGQVINYQFRVPAAGDNSLGV
ncbi:protein FAR-RED IMPAIRED RESPONSE 1-like [Arachis stenosperma]|uniref:protein FAR-RED IMPAIRED RESPONSE 1-like n=1 Tax=Arachis stenosperma TaxID=217475 RepID=UPI0025AD2509|nr:protein FAR-RED IMPAIRED RESPONSE 1-like [Arachis stenosperma]